MKYLLIIIYFLYAGQLFAECEKNIPTGTADIEKLAKDSENAAKKVKKKSARKTEVKHSIESSKRTLPGNGPDDPPANFLVLKITSSNGENFELLINQSSGYKYCSKY